MERETLGNVILKQVPTTCPIIIIIIKPNGVRGGTGSHGHIEKAEDLKFKRTT